jgi:hypothetical protein
MWTALLLNGFTMLLFTEKILLKILQIRYSCSGTLDIVPEI